MVEGQPKHDTQVDRKAAATVETEMSGSGIASGQRVYLPTQQVPVRVEALMSRSPAVERRRSQDLNAAICQTESRFYSELLELIREPELLAMRLMYFVLFALYAAQRWRCYSLK